MRIVVTGLNHRSASLATREAMSISREQLPGALVRLHAQVHRGVILATCNRTEIYTTTADHSDAVRAFIDDQFRVDSRELESSLYTLEHDHAVEHLYRVAASLDSLIIGESEILGQVRDAFSVASRQGVAGGVIAHVFHNALRVGKRARAETGIGRNALSVSRAAVELVRRLTSDLESRTAVIVGVGEASALAGQALRDAGVSSLVVANRTPSHGEELATDLGAVVAPLDDLSALIGDADVVVTSTGASDFVLSADVVQRSMSGRAGRPLVVMDLAMPRDVEPAAADIPGVHLYSMYDLELIAEANHKEREVEAVKAETIVADEVAKFRTWWKAQEVTPTIAGIRDHAESIRLAEVARTLKRLNGAGPEAADAVDALSKALVKKLLHGPTRTLHDRNDQALTEAARALFGLAEE